MLFHLKGLEVQIRSFQVSFWVWSFCVCFFVFLFSFSEVFFEVPEPRSSNSPRECHQVPRWFTVSKYMKLMTPWLDFSPSVTLNLSPSVTLNLWLWVRHHLHLWLLNEHHGCLKHSLLHRRLHLRLHGLHCLRLQLHGRLRGLRLLPRWWRLRSTTWKPHENQSHFTSLHITSFTFSYNLALSLSSCINCRSCRKIDHIHSQQKTSQLFEFFFKSNSS